MWSGLEADPWLHICVCLKVVWLGTLLLSACGTTWVERSNASPRNKSIKCKAVRICVILASLSQGSLISQMWGTAGLEKPCRQGIASQAGSDLNTGRVGFWPLGWPCGHLSSTKKGWLYTYKEEKKMTWRKRLRQVMKTRKKGLFGACVR